MSAMIDRLRHLWHRRKPVKVETTERRRAPRHQAVENRALLTWRAGDERPVVPARVKDISLLGALLAAEGRPPCGQDVWIRLLEPTQTDWIEARVARVTESGEIGLAFSDRCPFALYRAVLHGGTPERRRHETACSEFGGGDWR